MSLPNLSGTKPGSDKAIRQHKAMAQGYDVTGDEKRCVETHQPQTKTGCAYAPGMTSGKR